MKHLHRLFYPPAWSIAAKLSAALLCAALIPMSFNAYYNLQRSLVSAEENEYRKLELLAASTASRLDQLIIDVQRVVAQISSDRVVVAFLSATTREIQANIRPGLQLTLENIFRSNPEYDAVYLLDARGRCVASTDPTFLRVNYSFREYFQQAIRGHPYTSSILMGTTTGRPGLYLSSPVRSPRGRVVGVAVLKIREEDIAKIVNGSNLDGSYAFLIDQQGVIVSHPNKSLMYHSLAPLSPQTQNQIIKQKQYRFTAVKSLALPKLATVMVGAKESGHASYYSSSEQTYQNVGFAPLEVEPWVLGVNKPRAKFTAPLNRLIWQNSLSVVAVGAIATFMALLLARSIAKPIHILTAAAQALDRDDFEPQVLKLHQQLVRVSRTPDDIGQLVRVFMHMAEEVRMRDQRLKLQVLELQIEVDETKRAYQVAEITTTDYFQQLQQKAKTLRTHTTSVVETETSYWQHLHQKAQKLKKQ